MTADHARLDALLRSAQTDDGSVDAGVWAAFRGGLLRHIALEEKILMPLLRDAHAELANAAQIHADHARLVKLLASEPSAALLDRIRDELATHNAAEEGPNGLYATSDAAAGDDAGELVSRLRAMPVSERVRARR